MFYSASYTTDFTFLQWPLSFPLKFLTPQPFHPFQCCSHPMSHMCMALQCPQSPHWWLHGGAEPWSQRAAGLLLALARGWSWHLLPSSPVCTRSLCCLAVLLCFYLFIIVLLPASRDALLHEMFLLPPLSMSRALLPAAAKISFHQQQQPVNKASCSLPSSGCPSPGVPFWDSE